jgi:hypothetical protein
MVFRLQSLFAQIFEKKTKEPDHQPHDALYAFRTIITMLSLIQSEKRISEERIKRHSSQELKIVDALAAIIIRENGVAAVAANPPDGSGTIQVFTSVSFWVAQNPREPERKNPEASSTGPFIVDPNINTPEHLKANGITKPCELLDAFLARDW